MDVFEAKEVFQSCVESLSEPLKSAVEFTLTNWSRMKRAKKETLSLPDEEWRDVVGYEGLYKVSNLGRVKSFHFRKPHIIRAIPDGTRYLRVCLCKEGFPKRSFAVHILVAQAFIPNPENKPIVHHRDTIRTNNHVENLEWATSSENNQYSYDAGSRKSGCGHHRAKLTHDEVVYIRSHYIKGDREFGAGALSKRFNLARETLRRVVIGKSYKNIL